MNILQNIGPKGEPGLDGDKYYEQIVSIPSTSVNIPHNLNKYPSITVMDSANEVWVVDIEHVDKNNAIITTGTPISGTVFAN